MTDHKDIGKLRGITGLTEQQLRTLLRLADCIIPEDADPSATQAGFATFLERNWEDLGEWAHGILARGLGSLQIEAEQRHAGRGFADLSEEEADALVRAIERGEVESEWATDPILFLHQTIAILRIPVEALRRDGGIPAVMNAANEIAVEAFLGGRLAFTAIPMVVQTVMNTPLDFDYSTLSGILRGDQMAREATRALIEQRGETQ